MVFEAFAQLQGETNELRETMAVKASYIGRTINIMRIFSVTFPLLSRITVGI